MSTQINITVDSGGLTDRAKQQQQAARQAQLEKERTLNLSVDALDKRVAAQAAKGQSLDGQPLYTAGFKQPQVDRRPAANRTGGVPSILISPTQDFTTYGLFTDTKNIKNKTAATYLWDGSTYLPPTDPDNLPLVYSPSGGPANAAYLRSAGAPLSDTFETRYLLFLLCDNADVRGVNLSSPSNGGYKVLTGPGLEEVSAKQIKTPIHKLKKYTIEYYMQAATGGPIDPNIGFVLADSEVEIYTQRQDGTSFLLFSAYLAYDGDSTIGPRVNTFRLDINGLGTPKSVYFGWPNSLGNPDVYEWPTKLDFGSWYHFAYVRDGNTESMYFQGTLVGSNTDDFDYVSNLTDLLFSTVYIAMYNGGVGIMRPGLQGFRFTPKALYSGNFTPSPVINSFA